MSWFHHTLEELDNLLTSLKEHPEEVNFHRFHTEVRERLQTVKQEEKHIFWLGNKAENLGKHMRKVHSSLELLEGYAEDFTTQHEVLLAKKSRTEHRIQNYEKLVEEIREGVERAHVLLGDVEKGLKLIRSEQKREEV